VTGRRLLAALVVLAGLLAYVYFVEIRGTERREKEKEASEKVFPEGTEAVAELSLRREEESLRLVKDAGGWRIVEPVPAAPDSDAVDRLLEDLDGIRITRELGEVEDLAPYRLAPPALRVEVKPAGGKPARTLLVGDDAPTGGGVYVRIGEAGRVAVVTGAAPLRSATMFALRDRSLLRFDPGRVTSLRILRGREEIALAKSGGTWRLTAPVLAPADEASVTDLLYALERLTAQEFVDEKPAPEVRKQHGLEPAQERVVLASEEWEGERVLEFGNTTSGSVLALRPGSGELVKVPDAAQQKWKGGADRFRRKEVLPFSRWDVAKLRIEGLPGGPLELVRGEESGWIRQAPVGAALPEDPVDLLLRNLSDLKAVEFLDRPGSDLARYGLARPAVRMQIWKTGSLGQPPAVIEVGRESRGKVAMRDPAWPPVLQVDAAVWKTAAEQAGAVTREAGTPEITKTPPAPSTQPAGSGVDR
jgi:hypothetical protein